MEALFLRKKGVYPFRLFILFFWPCRAACGLLVPRPGLKPMPLAVEVWSLNHWTREVPRLLKCLYV